LSEAPIKSEAASAAAGIARSPMRELLAIALPTVATMTSYTLMQFVDMLMVSRIGPDPVYVGAQGNGGLAAFVPIACVMGFLTVINTYVSQNLGAGRPERAPAYAWTGLWWSLMAAIVLVPYALVLPQVFALLRAHGLDAASAAALVRRDELAGDYGRILIYGAFFTMASRGIAHFFYGMHKPSVTLIASLTGNAVNLFLNGTFIYGEHPLVTGVPVIDPVLAVAAALARVLGTPAMGVSGSALSTVIGTAVELSIPLAVFLSPRFDRLYRTRGAWRPSPAHFKDIARIGWPGAAMFGNEIVCWAFFMVYLVGEFGPLHSTAGWIAHRYMSLSFMPAVGLSIAVTAVVGRCMGAGKPEEAAHRAWLGVRLALGYMGVCGVLFLIFRHALVGLFIPSSTPPADVERVVALGSGFLLAVSAFQLFDAIAMVISGALRGAGDTVWPGVATLVLSWSIIVGGGLAMTRFFPHLESLGPWIAAAVYVGSLATALLIRFVRGRWKRINLLKGSAVAHPATPATEQEPDALPS
jgi:MATE family multidrug resistance protein